MLKKILLLSRDPGGANTIIPIVVPLRNKGYEVLLFGKDMALKRYEEEGLKGLDIAQHVKELGLNEIRTFVGELRPNLVLTGTSADDMTEKFVWKAADELRIPSFAIVEQWVNYGIRFSEYHLADIREYYRHRKHKYLPSGIFVTDDYTKKEMGEEGIPSLRIIVSGNPYFEYFITKATNTSKKRIDNLRDKLGINKEDKIISFVSEPISKMYGQDGYLGYTEKTVMREVIEALLILKQTSKINIALIIRLHPKDGNDHYADIISKYSDLIKIIVERDMRSYELILMSDIMCGMYSMLLIESLLLKKPIVSVQIGLKRKNPFVLDRLGVVKSILDKDKLLNGLREIVCDANTPTYKFDYIEHPIKNITEAIEKVLCQN